jgi:hypothetical protein
MSGKLIKLVAVVTLGTAGVASADVTAVNCDGFVISMSEDIATQGQERAGSAAEFEENVCTTAQQLPLDTYDRPTVVAIRIMPMDIETKVTVFPTSRGTQAN